MAAIHVRSLEVFPLHEPRLSSLRPSRLRGLVAPRKTAATRQPQRFMAPMREACLVAAAYETQNAILDLQRFLHSGVQGRNARKEVRGGLILNRSAAVSSRPAAASLWNTAVPRTRVLRLVLRTQPRSSK